MSRVTQKEELSRRFQKIEFFAKKPGRGIHSEMHALAKEVSDYCGEPKEFAMYLGVIKNIGLSQAYRVFAELKQSKEIKTPGKLFLYLSSYKKPKNGNSKRARKNTAQKTKKRGRNNV